MSGLERRERRAHARRRIAGGRSRGRFGTPCYVYSRAMIEGAFREFDDGPRGRGPHGLLRGEGQLEPRDPRGPRPPGRGLRHRLRRRARARAGGRAARQPRDLLRRRQVRGGDARRARRGHQVLQRRERAASWSAWTRWRPRRACARRCRCASTRTSTRAPIPTSPPGSRATSSAFRMRTRSPSTAARRRWPTSAWPASAATSARRSSRPRRWTRRWSACSTWSMRWRSKASGSSTSTWAAASASAIATRRRRTSPRTARALPRASRGAASR